MVRNERDNTEALSPFFTVTNREVITSFDADTATDTVQSNAIAYLFETLIKEGIINGTVS